MNQEPAATFDLRPLNIGEILDRSVTLYVRNFAPLTLIMLLVLIPSSIARYYAMQGFVTPYSQLLQQISGGASGHPASPAKINKLLAQIPALGPATLAGIVLGLFVVPFANVAIALGVAMVYNNQRVNARLALLGALRRWPAVLLMVVFEVLAILIWFVAGTLLFGILAVLAVVAAKVLPLAGIIGGVLLFLAFLIWMFMFIPLVLAILCGYCAIGIERASASQAFAEGLAGTYNRSAFKRTLLVSVALLAVEVGSFIPLAVGQAIAIALRSALLDAILTTLFSMVSAAFLAVVVAVYYYDVRVRLEVPDPRIAASA